MALSLFYTSTTHSETHGVILVGLLLFYKSTTLCRSHRKRTGSFKTFTTRDVVQLSLFLILTCTFRIKYQYGQVLERVSGGRNVCLCSL